MSLRYAILEAPSCLGLRPTGVEDASTALLDIGLGRRLGARYAGRVDAPPYSTVRDPLTRIRNAQGIASYALSLADAVQSVVARGECPVVLGGDCSVLLGDLLALRRWGRYGALFLDGHCDYWTPESEPHGEAASMDLALVTGRGPALLTDLEGRRPLVRMDDVIGFGMRDDQLDSDYLARDGGVPIPAELTLLTLAEIRASGFARAIARVAAFLARADVAGCWVHLDVDVLDDAIMPAVDYRMPGGGLRWDELVACLATVITSGRMTGIEITIYNPQLDTTRSAGRDLVDALIEGLR
jgi:arginase